MNVIRVSETRWTEAQKFELRAQRIIARRGDDYNFWWAQAFENYRVLEGKLFKNVLEVGCGPHTNVRLILPLIDYETLYLEDPLIASYLPMQTSTWILGAKTQKEPLEELALEAKSIDLCVCINVLDHVRDAELCMAQMLRVLKTGGILVIGQDLSNEEDYSRCPESWSDPMHPIKLDESFFDYPLKSLYRRILPREEGRNPACHYGVLAWIAQK